MKLLALVTATLMTITPALAEEKSEGRLLAELAFDSISDADRDFIDMGEFSNFGSSVFAGMDYDDSGKLSLKEFLSWDFGIEEIAAKNDRINAYETALRVVFAFWDRNGDNEISKTELRQSTNIDFQRADANNDAILTKDEFTGGFSIMVALRAAINPAPVE